MRNSYKIIVLFVVIAVSQEVEITTSEPSNSAVKKTPSNQDEGLTSNQTKARPSFHRKPGGVTQIVSAGPLLLDSPNSTTLSSETSITTTEDVKAQTVLEYKPLKPFQLPLPINQLIPPAKPNPEPTEGHETAKPAKSPPVQTFPPDLVDRFPELTTLNKRTTIPKVMSSERQPETSTEDNFVKPVTVLGYKPITSFYHPHPVTLPQLIPTGKPWPASAEGYETTKQPSSAITLRPELVTSKTTTVRTLSSKKTKLPLLVSRKTTTPKVSTAKQTTTSQVVTMKTTTEDNLKPITVLEYQPTTTFFRPHPVTPVQIIKPGKPWPASAEGYQTTIASSAPTSSSPLVTTEYVEAQTVLEYKPSTTFYHPHPVTIPQLIQPGKPWPASAESDETTISPSSASTTKAPALPTKATTDYAEAQTVLEYKPSTSFYHPHPVTIPQLIPPGKPWPASAESDETTISPSSASTTKAPALPTKVTTEFVEAQTVLGYKPSTSFYHPNPATIPQLISPGKPWPASAENDQTTNSFPSASTTKAPALPTEATTEYVEVQTVLEYKPSTSFYHPHPVTIPQLIPPGKPWPASANENGTSPNLTNRFPELGGTKTTTTKTPDKKTTKKPTISTATPTPASSTRIILTYKPQRPWYHPRPGNTVGQIIPPGKPWPASPSGYPSFSATTLPPWLKDSIDKDAGNNEISVPHYKAEELQSLKEEPSLEPNALQYYGPSITAKPTYNIAPTPFTSGTQKTTISDIADILKEVHNIKLVSGNSPPSPSHLLSFDIDKDSQIGSPVVRRPTPKEYQQQNQPPLQVYDGAVSLDSQVNRERIFTNPKFVQAQ